MCIDQCFNVNKSLNLSSYSVIFRVGSELPLFGGWDRHKIWDGAYFLPLFVNINMLQNNMQHTLQVLYNEMFVYIVNKKLCQQYIIYDTKIQMLWS